MESKGSVRLRNRQLVVVVVRSIPPVNVCKAFEVPIDRQHTTLTWIIAVACSLLRSDSTFRRWYGRVWRMLGKAEGAYTTRYTQDALRVVITFRNIMLTVAIATPYGQGGSRVPAEPLRSLVLGFVWG